MKAGIDYPGICVAFFCHDGNGKFVFHKRGEQARTHAGMWDCGGGGLEHGETIEEGLFRELKEEYTCEGIIEEKLEINTYLKEEDGVLHHWVVHPFIIKVNPEDVAIGEPHKASDLSWYSMDNLPSPLQPGVAADIETYKHMFKKYYESRT